MELEPEQKVGKYKIKNRLGQGGMSNVYLAEDTSDNSEVVLKFPHQDALGDIATHTRLEREVKIGQTLKHDHIQYVKALEFHNNAEFMVLEYVPGKSLRGLLKDRGKHDVDDDVAFAVDLGKQIGSALAYAHTHNIAHRDIKPENIIVTPDNVAKVMDFGIALMKGARRVTWGPLSNQVGTPDYMAPEQIEGGRGDARTDIYALGMILYEIVARRLPYDGDNALAVMNQHVNVKPEPIHHFRKNVPSAIDEIIMKAIRIKPDNRWQTMDEFVKALSDFS
jgi:serine/threonine-protein kinase